MAKTRVRVPGNAKKGEVVEVKAIIAHKMESGQRKDADGNRIPQMIVTDFEVGYNGNQVFHANFHGAVSANPNIAFFLKATESGTIDFKWTETDGTVSTNSAEITVA